MKIYCWECKTLNCKKAVAMETYFTFVNDERVRVGLHPKNEKSPVITPGGLRVKEPDNTTSG